MVKMDKPQSSDFCLLCGARPAVIGVFVPEDPKAWGAPAGKSRFVRYCLCSSCQKKPDAPDRVEKVIRAELARGGVVDA